MYAGSASATRAGRRSPRGGRSATGTAWSFVASRTGGVGPARCGSGCGWRCSPGSPPAPTAGGAARRAAGPPDPRRRRRRPRLTAGDRAVRLPVEPPAEAAELATAINELASDAGDQRGPAAGLPAVGVARVAHPADDAARLRRGARRRRGWAGRTRSGPGRTMLAGRSTWTGSSRTCSRSPASRRPISRSRTGRRGPHPACGRGSRRCGRGRCTAGGRRARHRGAPARRRGAHRSRPDPAGRRGTAGERAARGAGGRPDRARAAVRRRHRGRGGPRRRTGADRQGPGGGLRARRAYQRYKGVRKVGSGLGLALAARLVRRLGGRIEAGHAPEGGARFTVYLPLTST